MGQHRAQRGAHPGSGRPPALRAIWDPGNDYVSGGVPYPDGYRAVLPYIVHVHVKDAAVEDPATGLTRWACIGTGEVDYAGQIAALRRDGYRGALSVETHWRKPGDSGPESTRDHPRRPAPLPVSTAPPVEVRNLRKRYGKGPWANDGISFAAVGGEILGIVGPNGAGKTTLIRQITTELRSTSGEVRVFGIDAVKRPHAVKRMMGVMPQEATLYWGLSVHHHLRIFAKLRGLRRAPPGAAVRS